MSFKQFVASISFLFLLCTVFIYPQETVEYRNSVNISNPAERITALKNFIKNYPASHYIPGAKYYIFNSYIKLNKVDSALFYASGFVDSYPESSKIGPYYEVVSLLVEKKVGLDTANVYSAKAAEMAEERNIRQLPMVLDLRAMVLNLIGKPDSALSIEQKAIAGKEDDPDMLNHLSIFQEGAGQKTEAIKTAAKAILMGNYDEAVTNFSKWISKIKPEKSSTKELRNNIVKNVLKDFSSGSKDKNAQAIKSQEAVFLAYTGTDYSLANKYALEALKSLNKESSLDDKITYTKNYAIVLSAENKNREAVKELTSVEKLVDPWDADFWYTLGKAYVKIGENQNAEKAYLSGLIAYQAPKLVNAFKELTNGKSPTDPAIQKIMEDEKNKLENFDPGKFKEPAGYKGNVILAELFTGAECPPCAGADYAYDALSQFYPRSVLAILEYHVHIPAPDPMTNPQTFRRYLYYGGNFGTPTAFIEGKEKITGGGPKFLLENRFHVYQYAINKFINERPEVSLKGASILKNDTVSIKLEVKTDQKPDTNVTLHIALVEKEIHYPGGNGINKHIFVVRHLIGNARGLALNLINNKETVNQFIDVSEVENKLSEYLDNPTTDISWRVGTRFTGWRQKTDKINRKDLAVVAWLQNNLTKQIYQAYYMDVTD